MTGPSKPTMDDPFRVYRGGSWYGTTASDVRAAYRYDYTPTYRIISIGFRCAQRGVRQVLKVTP